MIPHRTGARAPSRAYENAGHELIEQYRTVRATTEALAEPLSDEDQGLQAMASCSPTKWHLAHTTWFFETFLLEPLGVPAFDARWGYLYNSYYDAVGPRHARHNRGLLSRPSAAQVADYRRAVDRHATRLMQGFGGDDWQQWLPVVQLGLAHEQQHQELILTDILNAFSANPLLPAYRPAQPEAVTTVATAPRSIQFIFHPGGLVEVGASHATGFHFDNEGPRHRVWIEPFEIGDRLVTVAEWKAFADAGGYDTPSLWLSEGYEWVQTQSVRTPLYTRREGAALLVFGLGGEREALDGEPITNVSYFEADAVARFLGARLPTEFEWELVAAPMPAEGRFLQSGALRALPAPAQRNGEPVQLYGDAWEWTQSPYAPYPGYHPPPGALGEYNAKFMVNQMVLRGGSAFTPEGHMRASYRNFWPPATRFQLTGVRLARGAKA